jgi:hypothetical protein
VATVASGDRQSRPDRDALAREEDAMVKVALQVGHPSYESSRRFEAELAHLPRSGEYLRAEEGMLRGAGAHAWADLWSVLAVVHEPPGDGIQATLHVAPAATRDLFELLERGPRR